MYWKCRVHDPFSHFEIRKEYSAFTIRYHQENMLFTSRFPADGKRGWTVRFLSLTVNFTERLM